MTVTCVSKQLKTLIATLTLLVSFNAVDTLAATATKKNKPASPMQATAIDLIVPRTEFDVRKTKEQVQAPSALRFETAISSWSPSGFHESANVNQTSDYRTTGFAPQVSLNVWRSDGWLWRSVSITPKYGFSFSQLARTGTYSNGSASFNVSQTMNLGSLRAGVELGSSQLNTTVTFGSIRPFVNASLLPSWGLAPKTEISDGSSRLYFLTEEVLGISAQVNRLADSFDVAQFAFQLGLQATQGIDGSGLNGTGLIAGARVEL
jgi:hypothetical protein